MKTMLGKSQSMSSAIPLYDILSTQRVDLEFGRPILLRCGLAPDFGSRDTALSVDEKLVTLTIGTDIWKDMISELPISITERGLEIDLLDSSVDIESQYDKALLSALMAISTSTPLDVTLTFGDQVGDVALISLGIPIVHCVIGRQWLVDLLAYKPELAASPDELMSVEAIEAYFDSVNPRLSLLLRCLQFIDSDETHEDVRANGNYTSSAWLD